MLARPSAPGLVLGSSQREADADRQACASAGCSLVRRRSGGGAVLVAPGRQVWLDVYVPRGDPLDERDVVRAAFWLGELWREALRPLVGAGSLAVHRGGLAPGSFGRLACFAGLGPGEVTLAGRKVVGISQRRDRAGTWLSSLAPIAFRPEETASLLALDATERARLRAELAARVHVLALEAGVLELALLEALAALA
ncbi:MAG TPA: hypothetical protein VKV23_03365 [Acidimicrobiales bacterium]|nr:hypothetical protein [Acidimicrobiales bacterium]